MCNGNKYCNPPLFAKHIARILIPLTTPYFKATSFFGEYLSGIDNRQARPYGVLVRRFADDGSSGGLKGKTAPGDAHPYLALFYLGKKCRASTSQLLRSSSRVFPPKNRRTTVL